MDSAESVVAGNQAPQRVLDKMISSAHGSFPRHRSLAVYFALAVVGSCIGLIDLQSQSQSCLHRSDMVLTSMQIHMPLRFHHARCDLGEHSLRRRGPQTRSNESAAQNTWNASPPVRISTRTLLCSLPKAQSLYSRFALSGILSEHRRSPVTRSAVPRAEVKTPAESCTFASCFERGKKST